MSSPPGYSSLPPYGGGGDDSGVLLRIRSRTEAVFPTRRSWRELLSHPSSYSVPDGFADLTARLRRNLSHFRVNYAMVALLAVFLGLLYHPISMIVFLALLVFWLVLYLSRDEPIELLGRAVDDRAVLAALAVVTAVALVLTGVWLNVAVSAAIAAAAVALHAAFRMTEDLFLDEDEAAEGGLPSVVGARF
ncbi:PRA1 family protein E-like [Salvia divinorum]|uniref:PRA1 family protein n=1 Tax=Salvia divinorum TaxID=28513 RepID=A0ABD1GVY1_SALDI